MKTNNKSFLSGFANIDETSNTDFYITYLKTINQDEQTQAERKKVIGLLGLKQGYYVLDIGCGIGEDSILIANAIGEKGSIVGIDKSEDLINIAKNNNSNLNINFTLMDAHELSFIDNTFDACKAERCFSHLDDPIKALKELKRVTKNGGKILIHDNDWENFIVYSNFPETSKKVKNYYLNFVKNGDIGRQLYKFFKQCNISNVTIDFTPYYYNDYNNFNSVFYLEHILEKAVEHGFLTEQEINEWIVDLKRNNEVNHFFAYGSGIIVYEIV